MNKKIHEGINLISGGTTIRGIEFETGDFSKKAKFELRHDVGEDPTLYTFVDGTAVMAAGSSAIGIAGGLTATANISAGGTISATGGVTATSLGNAATCGQVLCTSTTLTAAEIVGTAAGDIGHAAGATLVAAPGEGYVLEFISAILIYDYATAAYTGGGDDNVIQNGDGAVALSTTIAGADLLEAAGDKIVQVNALAASDQALAENKPITLKGTALTQPGTAAGVLRAHVTYRVHTTGL